MLGAGEGNDFIAVGDLHDAHALGSSAHDADVTCQNADDDALGGDQNDIVIFVHDLDAADLAADLVRLVVLQAVAAASLDAVLLQTAALAEAMRGHGENCRIFADSCHGNDLVALTQLNGSHAARRT